MKDSPKVDCKFPVARLGARTDADVSYPAEIIICSGTGETEMISRKLGLEGGIAKFTVEVPSDGGY